MTFKLHIPGRLEIEAPPVANPANPLIGSRPDTAPGTTPAPDTISGLAGLAGLAAGDDHEARIEHSSVISADGAPYWDADAMAGLPPWSAAEIVTFEKRVARSTWLGYSDAKGRAERLRHRDRDADDRCLCVECQHAGTGYRCARREAFLLDQLQRCPMFQEKPL